MEALLSRFRNLTVLLVVVFAQLVYLAYQVKTDRDERLIRVWAVTAVTPMAGIVEAVRHNTIGFLEDYFILLDVREQNRRLKSLNDRLQMENTYFRNELATAENARALVQFQAQTPSRTIAARVIGNSTVVSAKAVFVDRGSTSGIENGMAVVIPDGVVGKVVAVYPLVSQVLLVTDPTFKVGVETQKGHVHGVLNCGAGKCSVEQVQNEDKVTVGDWFFTSGEDRVFPKGFPVGKVISAQPGQGMKDIKLNLSGSPNGVDEVLIVLRGVHQNIPTAPVVEEAVDIHTLPPPPVESGNESQVVAKPQTEADKVLQKYDAIGKEQGHVYGALGSPVPNFNIKTPGTSTPAAPTDSAGARTDAEKSAPSAAAATPPAILGSRPGESTASSKTPAAAAPDVSPKSNAPPVVKPAALGGPILPLGAPRRKPASPPAEPKQTPAATPHPPAAP